jgi:hypothetical protein
MSWIHPNMDEAKRRCGAVPGADEIRRIQSVKYREYRAAETEKWRLHTAAVRAEAESKVAHVVAAIVKAVEADPTGCIRAVVVGNCGSPEVVHSLIPLLTEFKYKASPVEQCVRPYGTCRRVCNNCGTEQTSPGRTCSVVGQSFCGPLRTVHQPDCLVPTGAISLGWDEAADEPASLPSA